MFRITSLIAIFGSFIAVSMATPVDQPLPPTKPDSSFVDEGPSGFINPVFDIKYTKEQLIRTRSGIPDERYRWRNGFIVHPDPAFNAQELSVINAGMYELSQVLCIRVLMWPQNSNPTGDYIRIIRGQANTGCYSNVGRLGGRQNLNLQYNGCIHKGTVMHELIHALGYHHEQTRPDRDNYVNIHYLRLCITGVMLLA